MTFKIISLSSPFPCYFCFTSFNLSFSFFLAHPCFFSLSNKFSFFLWIVISLIFLSFFSFFLSFFSFSYLVSVTRSFFPWSSPPFSFSLSFLILSSPSLFLSQSLSFLHFIHSSLKENLQLMPLPMTHPSHHNSQL